MTESSHKHPNPKRPTGTHRASRRVFVPCAPMELESFSRVDWVLRTILKEVKQNHGKYPHSDRAPNVREVLLRAGLSKTYLEFQGGTAYREHLKARCKKKIKRVLGRIKSGRYRSASRSQATPNGERSESAAWFKLQEQLRSLKQRWVEAELEFIDAENRVRDLEKIVQSLTGENERLRGLVAESNIHILHRHSDM